MIIECTQCGRKGTLDAESHSGKKVRLKCPYCSQEFNFLVPQDGNAPEVAAALAVAAPPAAVEVPSRPASPAPEPAPPPAPATPAPAVAPPSPRPVTPVPAVAPPPPRPVTSAPAVAPPAPEVSDALINEAKRIARLIISEVKLYNQDKIAKAKTRKEVLDLLKNDLIKGKQHYNSRIASKLPAGPDYFMEAVKEILLAGKS